MGEIKAAGGARIDEEVLREALEDALYEAGQRLAEARCGLKALKILTEHVGNGHSHPGNDPTDEDVISGAEVGEGLRFLLNLVERELERTGALIDPATILQRLRR